MDEILRTPDSFAESGDYLMVSIPSALKPDLAQWGPALQTLWESVKWHVDAATYIHREPNRWSSPLGTLVARNHLDIAHSLSSAHIQLSCGLLADAMTFYGRRSST